MTRGSRARKSPDHIAVESDPRVRDPVIFNRLKLMVEHEACHPAWGCVLYQLHRTGYLSNEQREAGDIYQQIYYDYRRAQDVDPDDLPEEAQELWIRRIDRSKHRWDTASEILGLGQKAVDSIVIENNQPTGEKQRKDVRDGLQLISNFFGRGRNKRQTN